MQIALLLSLQASQGIKKENAISDITYEKGTMSKIYRYDYCKMTQGRPDFGIRR